MLYFQTVYSKEIVSKEKVLNFLKICRSQFFKLLKRYKENEEGFSLKYRRKNSKRIDKEKEILILEELNYEKEIFKKLHWQIDLTSCKFSGKQDHLVSYKST